MRQPGKNLPIIQYILPYLNDLQVTLNSILEAQTLITYLLGDLFLLVTLLLQELLQLEALELHLPLSLVLKEALVGLHLVCLKNHQTM